MELQDKLRHLRKESGISQIDAAEKLEVSRQTIIAVENDKYNPSLELAMKLARCLGTTVEELFLLED